MWKENRWPWFIRLEASLPAQSRSGIDITGCEVDIKVNGVGDFPGGAVVKNPPAAAGDTGSSPGPGKSHMPWSN